MHNWQEKLYLDDEEFKYTKGALKFAKNIGLIASDTFEELEKRCIKKNKENLLKKENGEVIYGIEEFFIYTYLQYELTLFKLDFLQRKNVLNYQYEEISDQQKKEFFEKNNKIFTRCTEEDFSYSEVEMIIEKRLREEEYERNIQNILC